MKARWVVLAVLSLGWIAFAQQSPPADGVGLGNEHLSGNSSVSDVPSMSPNQNPVMTDSSGSTSGDQGVPAFAGSGGAETATEMNSQGAMGVQQSTAATAARRSAYGISPSNQNRAVVVQNGNQATPTLGVAGQNTSPQQGKSGNGAPPQQR